MISRIQAEDIRQLYATPQRLHVQQKVLKKKKGGNNVSSTGDHTSEESDSHPSQLDSQFPSILGLLLNNLSWGNIVSQISSQLVITQKEKYLLHLPYQKQILQALESLLYLFQIQS